MKRMTLRMNEALYGIIKERATREHRSIHAEILVVLERFFGKGQRIELLEKEDPAGSRDFREESSEMPVPNVRGKGPVGS
jgi:hypothetical protein